MLQGYLFGLLSALLSALAAVYTEWVMKRNNDSLYWQNIQLYAFGVLFNGLGLTANDVRANFHSGFWMHSMFDGYSTITLLVVANLAFSGLLVSWVMKFADSIMKVRHTNHHTAEKPARMCKLHKGTCLSIQATQPAQKH